MARCHHCRRGYVDADPRRKFGTCDDCANELRPDPPADDDDDDDDAENSAEILETWPAADFADLELKHFMMEYLTTCDRCGELYDLVKCLTVCPHDSVAETIDRLVP